MSGHLVLAMLFQGTDVRTPDALRVLVVFVGIIAVVALVVLLVMAGLAFGAWKTYKNVRLILNDVRGKAYPMVASVQGVVDDIRPKVVSITENVRAIVEDARPKVASVTENVRSIVEDATPKVKAMTENVKTMSTNFADTTTTIKERAQTIAGDVTETVGEANKKTRAQVDRVDGMISSAFNATGQVAAKIHHGIKVPVDEVVGWVNGAKAGLDKLMNHEKSGSKDGGTGASGSGSGFGFGRASGASSGRTPGPTLLDSILGMFGKKPSARGRSSAAETLAESGFPESGRESGRGTSAEVYQVVAAQAAEQDVLSDPSSAVAPSPGAQEVVDRFRESMKDVTPKPVS